MIRSYVARHGAACRRTRAASPWRWAAILGAPAVLAVPLGLAPVVAPASAATSAYQVTATIPVGSRPDGIAVDPATDTIYVANDLSDTVSVIDGATDQVTATVDVGASPASVAVDPATDTVYAANYSSGTVSVIDGATNQVTATITIGKATFPSGVAVNTATGTVYVSDTTGSKATMSVIGGATNQVTATITITTGQQNTDPPYPVAVDPATGTIYESNAAPGTLSVIDGAANQVTATVPVGGYPAGLAVDPDTGAGGTAYTANLGTASVSVVDGASNKVTASINTDLPTGVAVAPGTGTAYVIGDNPDGTSTRPGVLSVINEATNRIAAAVNVGIAPRGVAADQATGAIYTANYGSNTVSVVSKVAAPSAVGAVRSLENGAYCLDNSNHGWVAGNKIQLWKCNGGTDQKFGLAQQPDGATMLEAVAPSTANQGPWCVTATTQGAQLAIEPCTGATGQQIDKQGPYYMFAGTNTATSKDLVIDLTRSQEANGNKVQGWSYLGHPNQEWSLP